MAQDLRHPNVHPEASQWSEDQTLHVAVCYSNPRRWRTRRELANNFRMHMKCTPNVRMHFIELAYGDRPYEVTDENNPDDIRVRTPHELWHKENLLNIAIQHFPHGWKYGAYLDADFHFTRHDWALETIHQLQHHRWVQLFNEVIHVTGGSIPGKGHRAIHSLVGFAATYYANGLVIPKDWEKSIERRKNPLSGYMVESVRNKYKFPGAPGGGWAFTKAAIDETGGLLDKCILGSGDSFMAFGMVGAFQGMINNMNQYTKDYRDTILAWQKRAARGHGDIGFVDQLAVHHFHGPMKKRGYGTRDAILIEEKYSPTHDIFPDSQGVYQLNPDKPRLRDRLRQYFLSRCEDIPHLDDV